MEQGYKEEYGVGIIIYVLKRNRARLAAFGIDFDEGFSAGLVGLAKAIAGYDEKKAEAVSFLHYTYCLIWNSIFNEIRGRCKAKCLEHSGLLRIQDSFYRKTGRRLSTEQLADLLDADVEMIKDKLRATNSLESYSYKNEFGEPTAGYFIPNKNSPNPASQTEQKEFVDAVRSILEDRSSSNSPQSLTDEECFMIRLKFGIGVPADVTMEEMARLSGLSKSTVGSRLIKGLEKLKRDPRLKALQLDHFNLVEA